MNKSIRILSPGFNFLGEIDDYASFQLFRRWHKWGRFELHIAIDKRNTDMLQQNNMVFLGTDYQNVGIIEHREVGLDEDGTEMLLIKGYSLQKIIDRKIILPPAGQTHESYSNLPAESVIKGYINNSMVNPTDITRKAPNVVIATDKGRGGSLTWESRHKPLDEEIIKLSEASGLGWNIKLDFDNEKLIFDVYEGRDLTAGQDINPPAIFSVDFDNILSQSYHESTIDHKNVAYVAGQGEGIERVIKQVGDTTGLGRREMFVDARDLEDEDKLIPRGEQKLSEFEKVQALESQILTNSNLIYGKDYDLGDIVTVQNKKWNVTMDARIVEIREIYEESGFKLEASFGDAVPTLIDKVKQEVANASAISEGGGKPGEPGIQGPQGPQGIQGPKGDKGEQGAQGLKGDQGIQGERGMQGPKGNDGYTPIKGIDYFDGAKGEKGEPGYTPIKNVDYFDGAKGDKGDKGEQGPKGDKGDKGDIGPRGIQGIQGIQGPQGDNIADSIEWSKVLSKPPTFPPNIHTHGNQDLPSTFQNLTDGASSLPYRFDLIMYGDSDKYYPVHFAGGNQDLLRTIKIWRRYSERGPDDWCSATHKGSLNLEWKGNYGGWGGAVYSQWIYENSSQYTTLLARTERVDNSYGIAFFLRGGGPGGAIYHIASDQPLTWNRPYLTYSEPTPFYNQDLTFDSSNGLYDRYASKYRTEVDTEQLKKITVMRYADNYTHPASHPASIIMQNASNRFVTDAEKSNWDAKETPSGSQAKATKALNDAKAYADSIKPTKISQLTNDSNYATIDDIPTDMVSPEDYRELEASLMTPKKGQTKDVMFNANGSIKEFILQTSTGTIIAEKNTVFNSSSKITETLNIKSGNITLTKVTTFKSDGNISEIVS